MAATPAIQCFHSYLKETKKINIQFLNGVMSLYCEENSKTLKSFIFSKILRPNIGLSDPGPFYRFMSSPSVHCIPDFIWSVSIVL